MVSHEPAMAEEPAAADENARSPRRAAFLTVGGGIVHAVLFVLRSASFTRTLILVLPIWIFA
jgi:hypothetical protein